MKVVFIETRYKNIKINKSLLRNLPKKLVLITTVQYLNIINEIKNALKENGKRIIDIDLLPHCIYKHQVLGCSIKKINKDFDAFLFIGDGIFHVIGLLIKNNKDCFIYNPFSDNIKKIDNRIFTKIKKRIKSALIYFYNAKNVGIISSIKPGQIGIQKIGYIKELEKKFKDKKFYYFLCDTINPNSLQDFNFIDIFINTACPRIAYDDFESFPKPIINLDDLIEFFNLI